jgi:serine/threonine-protein kinase
MLNAAIMKALAKSPAERFQSASEMREALRRIESFASMTSAITETVPFLIQQQPPDVGRAQIETALLKSVGPIARILMARISPHCTTAIELRDRLAAQITDPAERNTFLRQVATAGQPTASTTMPSAATPSATPSTTAKIVPETPQWDPALLATAKKQLAVYTGPIASVIVDRAARKARTPQELYQILATEISSERDRTAFLRQTPWMR